MGGNAVKRERIGQWVGTGVGLLLVATLVMWRMQVARRAPEAIPKIIVGTNDQVYYSHGATMEEATALGHALQGTGFFNDRGTSVLLARRRGVPVISFVLNQGAWDRPEAVASFEEIGRRVAGAVGGFPVKIQLVDDAWITHKAMQVGKVTIGVKDTVYYEGDAGEAEAKALGDALSAAGYFQDLGSTVVLTKDGGTTLSFVVGTGVWDRPEAVAGFEHLARRVAGKVGGPPLAVRLLSAEMEVKKETTVR